MSNVGSLHASEVQFKAHCMICSERSEGYFRVAHRGDNLQTSLEEFLIALSGSTVLANRGSQIVAMAGSRVEAGRGAYVIALDNAQVTARAGSFVVHTNMAQVSEEPGSFVCLAEHGGAFCVNEHDLKSFEFECNQLGGLYAPSPAQSSDSLVRKLVPVDDANRFHQLGRDLVSALNSYFKLRKGLACGAIGR